jgi:hypothetical protein
MVEHPFPFKLFDGHACGVAGGGGGAGLPVQSPPPSEHELPFQLQAIELEPLEPGM